MMSEKYIEFSCVEVEQPIGVFYIGAIRSKDLVAISYADVRRIEARDVEKYLGIQRPLSPARVKELKGFVETLDATFPTSIVIAISSNKAEFDKASLTMRVLRDERVAQIIDGQHRIAGLDGYEDDNFMVNVTVFVDMDIEDQAMVFATINLKQTKVNKSLAYDLYEYTTNRSPQKTCHNIAKLLNNHEGSPLKDRIKILGTATGKPEESITQATFVDRLLPYMSREPMKDRDLLQRGKKPERALDKESERLIFRNMFIEDLDAEVAKILWNYFTAVAIRWPTAWPTVSQGNILNRTTGFGALMKFLRPAYLSLATVGEIPSSQQFQAVFKRMTVSDDEFTPENYQPGGSGESQLLRDFMSQSGLV